MLYSRGLRKILDSRLGNVSAPKKKFCLPYVGSLTETLTSAFRRMDESSDFLKQRGCKLTVRKTAD